MPNPTGRKITGGAQQPVYISGFEDGTFLEALGTQLAITEDGELWMTETERENDVSVVYVEDTINASKYILMVDKDNAAWPHRIVGQATNRVDITNIIVNIDAAVNGAGRFRLGVITRIDGTNADITYFTDFPFIATTTQLSVAMKYTPSQVKTDISGTTPRHLLSNSTETNVAALNTATALSSPNGNVAPGVGDIVLKAQQSAGNYNLYVMVMYHTQ